MFSKVERLKPKQGALLASPNLSHGRSRSGNAIIKGDNRRVLDALRDDLIGKVRCVYIDPPYNNHEDYTHYADSQRHSEWLDCIVGCASQLKDTLSENGSLWVSIDDKQMHYLKVSLDQVFGRENFASTIIWQQ